MNPSARCCATGGGERLACGVRVWVEHRHPEGGFDRGNILEAAFDRTQQDAEVLPAWRRIVGISCKSTKVICSFPDGRYQRSGCVVNTICTGRELRTPAIDMREGLPLPNCILSRNAAIRRNQANIAGPHRRILWVRHLLKRN